MSHGPQEQTWVKNTLSDLRSKLFTAERARDEMNSKIKSFELTKRTDQARLLEEKRQNDELLEELATERKRNQIEASDLRKEIVSLTGWAIIRNKLCVVVQVSVGGNETYVYTCTCTCIHVVHATSMIDFLLIDIYTCIYCACIVRTHYMYKIIYTVYVCTCTCSACNFNDFLLTFTCAYVHIGLQGLTVMDSCNQYYRCNIFL